VAAVEGALMAEVADGVPFVTALSERFPELSPLIDRELERSEAPEIHWVRPAPELLARLPPGLCERLLALPVHQEPHGGRVDVAAVDALGPHIAAEFAFHLQAVVRVLRASSAQLRAALAGASSASIAMVERSPPARAPVHDDEPVLNLSRSKFFAPEPAFAFSRALEDAVLDLGRAQSAEQVARFLCQALEPAISLVVAVRSGSMEGRAGSRALADQALKSFSLPTGKNSVFDIALRAGFYLGPLPSGIVHAELRSLLPSGASEDVYSAPVLVANRPVLALLMARFGPSLDATRRADRLILAASTAIERILLDRKRGAKES
jgi:hypothetical protein